MFKRIMTALYISIKQIIAVIVSIIAILVIVFSISHMIILFEEFIRLGYFRLTAKCFCPSDGNYNLEWNIFLFESAFLVMLVVAGLIKLVHSNLPPIKQGGACNE